MNKIINRLPKVLFNISLIISVIAMLTMSLLSWISVELNTIVVGTYLISSSINFISAYIYINQIKKD